MSSTAVSTSLNTTDLGYSVPKIPSKMEEIIIRPARLSDVTVMANLAYDAYISSSITTIIMPGARLYREDAVRIYRRGVLRRFLESRNLSVVACLASDPSRAIGHGQFIRLGNSEGAKRYIRERGLWDRLCIFLLSWLFHFLGKLETAVRPDRVSDKENTTLFQSSFQKDEQNYWKSPPERVDRWHAQQVIVSPWFQGKGVGRKIMDTGLRHAQKERVIMGVTASREGERLYRKLGFEMLGDFTHRIPSEEGRGGGIMIWYPEGKERGA